MDKNNEIAQISFFLATAGKDFTSVLDPKAGLNQKRGLRTIDFESEGAQCRFIYFPTFAQKTNPPWLDFINEQLEDKDRIKFSAESHSPNGILLIKLDDRVMAGVFGRSAASCLNRKAVEPDFGIKTAMNMCGNEEIRQTKTQSNAITTTHIDRQVNKPSDSFVFGLSEAEDLKYISAHLKTDRRITLQGRDSLTLKVIGEEKISWHRLVQQCRKFLVEYDSKAYIDLFPNFKNFRAATDAEVARLDGKLIDALKSKSFPKMQLGPPEFVSDDQYSYSYTNYPTRQNIIYSHLDLSQLDAALDLTSITIKKLQSHHIYAYSHADNKVLQNTRWSLYDCLVYECDLDGNYFILTSGRWSEVDSEFYGDITRFIQEQLTEEVCEEACKGIDISDNEKEKNREGIYNDKYVEGRKSSVAFDRAKLRIGVGKKDKEFCDILDLHECGVMRIINCKQYKDASSINYLFSQAKFYCDAFLHDEVFYHEIRKHIQESDCPIKDQYLSYIKPFEVISGQDYRVCLWLLYDKRKTAPKKDDIPLIAQYELKLMHDHLRRNCKFREIAITFIPVKVTTYTKTDKPAKAANDAKPKKASKRADPKKAA